MGRAFHNTSLKTLARQLRLNATSEENKLWYEFLRRLDCHFCRQKVIGNYIVDFYCASAKLIVELDGSQHYEEDGIKADAQRTEFLMSKGFRVVRYANNDVNNHFEDVCADILRQLNSVNQT